MIKTIVRSKLYLYCGWEWGEGEGGGGYNRGSINVKFCGINKFLTQNPITLTIFKTNLSKFVVVGQLKQKLPKQVNIGSLLKSY